jgi:tRNA threonylcarbamoyladenosine biosynthesis protein TsaE
LLVPGDFISLIGDLGAGKTQFVKGVAQGLGIPPEETVCSPSYTILNIHNGRIPLYHFDLYRLAGPDQVFDLGFEEYFAGEGVSIVEWADRIDCHNPYENLRICFQIDDVERRRLTFQPAGKRPIELVRLFADALPQKSV